MKVAVTNTAEWGEPEVYAFEQPRITIGRKPSNDLVLPDPKQFVSSHHAEIRKEGDAAYLVDVGSKNSTFLNGNPLQARQPCLLEPGDTFRIGSYEIQYEPPETDPDADQHKSSEAAREADLFQAAFEKSFMNLGHEDALRRAVWELKMLNELALEIGAADDLEGILATIVRRSMRAVRAAQGVITLMDELNGQDESHGGDRAKTIFRTAASFHSHHLFHVSHPLVEWMLLHKKPLRLNNPRQDPRFTGLILDAHVHSILCIPLVLKSELVGLLTVYNKKEPGGFEEDDERLLLIIASQSAQIIERQRLDEVEAKARELQVENDRNALELEKARELEKAYLAIQKQAEEIRLKNEENERLLLNILPAAIADRLKAGEETIADAFTEATVLFSDIVHFTQFSSQTPAPRLVALLNGLFSKFDMLALKHGVEKIKTIGDAYMAVAGVPVHREDHAEAVLEMALQMLETLEQFNASNGTSLQVRIGINTGPVVAGVIGTHKFIYDLWGDAVNTASRMESHGLPGRIHVTATTYERLKDLYAFESRGEIEIKGKEPMVTYLLKHRIVAPPRREDGAVGVSFLMRKDGVKI